MSPTLTVRAGERRVTGDTIIPDGDTLVVMSDGANVELDYAEVDSIIAGEPADADGAGGEVLAA